jgi:hypothetical protein
MTISYSITINRNDDSDYADTNEDITADVIALKWRLGMNQPFDSMAAASWAEITVWNDDQTYSPEKTTLQPGHCLRIQSDDETTVRTHFTGFIQYIVPAPGDEGKHTAVIVAAGVEDWLPRNQVRLPVMTHVTADEVIQAVLDACEFRRPVLDGYLIIGVSDFNTIGMHKLFGDAFDASLETGKSTFVYAGDTWGDGIRADHAIKQAVDSERGRFFTNRAGQLVFYNRHHTLIDSTSEATFANDMAGLSYDYGAEVVNQVAVTIQPRTIGAEDSVLWSLDEPQRLRPGGVRRLIARYRDDNDNPVGALTVIPPVPTIDYTANKFETGTATGQTQHVRVSLVKAGASAATLEIRHDRAYDIYLHTLTLRGTPLSGNDPITLQHTDHESITFYGLGQLVFDLPMLTSVGEAEELALYEVRRRRDPVGVVRALHTDTGHHPVQVLARTLFDRITITEDQTNHSADAVIIAEEHRVTKGGVQHQVIWLLEPADSPPAVVIGESKPDGSRVLVY